MKRAVALKYPEGAYAPFITAKGSGELAEKILEIAEEKHIRIERDLPLVNLLSAQDIGDAVPESAWQALAVIFSEILRSGSAHKPS